MSVTIHEIVGEVEPSQPDAQQVESGQPERTPPGADLRKLRSLHARLECRKARVRAD